MAELAEILRLEGKIKWQTCRACGRGRSGSCVVFNLVKRLEVILIQSRCLKSENSIITCSCRVSPEREYQSGHAGTFIQH